MTFKKTLTVLTVLFLLTEPMVASVTTVPAHTGACVTCGMKGTCGLVCCCRPHVHSHVENSPAPGLYPMGCHQDRDSAALELSNDPRWAPEAYRVFPSLSISSLPHQSKTVLLDRGAEVLTPPPNAGLLS